MPRNPKIAPSRGPKRTNPGGATASRTPRLYLGICLAVAGLGASAGVPMLYSSGEGSTEVDLMANGMASQVSRTGLTEAINWLRRQPGQPVLQFQPGPGDSLDPGIGLVREFQIAPKIFGRYEVWRSQTADDILKEVVDPLHSERQDLRAEDLSEAFDHPAPGQVWRLKSVGFVFSRPRPDTPFDRKSAAVLERKTLTVDVGRFGVCLPGQAALCARDGELVQVDRNGRLRGGSQAAGLYFGNAPDGIPAVASSSVTGVSPLVGARSEDLYDDSVRAIFGVDPNTLAVMADQRVASTAEFPWNLLPNSLYVVQIPDLTLTSTRPMRGGGVVYMKGNLTLSAGSGGPAADFAGFLYVDGDLTIDATANLRGAVVVTGKVKILGGKREASIDYDDGVLRTLRSSVGAYRMMSTITPLATGRHSDHQLTRIQEKGQAR